MIGKLYFISFNENVQQLGAKTKAEKCALKTLYNDVLKKPP